MDLARWFPLSLMTHGCHPHLGRKSKVGKAPEAPDPAQTAQAQAKYNQDTAVTQQLVNMVNQQNPWGSVNYDQTGTTGYTNADGKWVSIPSFTQTTTYTPEQQPITSDESRAGKENVSKSRSQG